MRTGSFVWAKLNSVLLLVILLYSSTNCVAGQQEKLRRSIDSLLQVHTGYRFNGVILVSRNGKTLYQKATGMADIARHQPLTMQTQFATGSLCKQFTAVLVAREIDRGHIRAGERLGKYLPDLPAAWKDSVTIQQLLQHTSGVHTPGEPLAFLPGTACQYSNYGYQLLGRVLEQVNGTSFCEQVTVLFHTCGMKYTVDPMQCAGSNKITSMANGYLLSADSLKQTDSLVPLLRLAGEASGGMIATAGDMVRWNECLHNGRLLSDGVYQLMWQPSGKIRQHPVSGALSYGFSFPLPLHHDGPVIFHSGLLSGTGFHCINFYYPASKTSVVVMENIANESLPSPELFFFETAIAGIVENVLLPQKQPSLHERRWLRLKW